MSDNIMICYLFIFQEMVTLIQTTSINWASFSEKGAMPSSWGKNILE